MTAQGKWEPGDRATYAGICEKRQGQDCTVTHTGIHGGFLSVEFDDGWGFLCQPTSLQVPQALRRAA